MRRLLPIICPFLLWLTPAFAQQYRPTDQYQRDQDRYQSQRDDLASSPPAVSQAQARRSFKDEGLLTPMSRWANR